MSYDYEEVKKTQDAALKVLMHFKYLCEKYCLKYFAIGGTCIGAIRHKGFIPWDDDIDVAMPVDDYYRFIDLCQTELKYPYEIITPNNIRHYSSMYIKLQDVSTTFIDSFAADYSDRYSGIYIDIFPLYGLPESKAEQEKIIRRNEMLKKINLKLRFPLLSEYRIKGRIIWLLLIPLRQIVPFYWATDKQQELFKNFQFYFSEKIYFPWRAVPGSIGSGTYKNVFYYEDFSQAIEVPFEDTTIAVPIGYDRYLTMDFGDYMTLPPETSRMPGHPKAIVDLDRPFAYYKELKEKENDDYWLYNRSI